MMTYQQFGIALQHTQEVLTTIYRESGWLRPDPARLAVEFSAVLHKWLGKKKIAQVVSRNALLAKQGLMDACASGDFCDSNMAMLEAWCTLTGTPQEKVHINSQPVLDVINEAWALAKLFNFRLRFEEATNSKGDLVPAYGFDNAGGDMFIVNAGLSECGRFRVKPSKYQLTQAAVDALAKLNAGRDVL